MEKPITKFVIKISLLCLPVILILSLYLATDPFKVLYHYDTYYVSGDTPRVGLNKDYVSTETFFNNYPVFKYDSFIFGSSRSMFYEVKDWQEQITSKKCFHFDASAETLYGIHAKLKYLDQNKIPIKNALIILDQELLVVTYNTDGNVLLKNPITGHSQGHIFLKHPKLSGQNWFFFQMEFVKAFFDKGFLSDYIKFRLTDEIEHNIFQGGFLDDTPIEYDLLANEIRFSYYENVIKKNPADFYYDGKSRFYKRDISYQIYPSVIKDDQKKLLNEIYDVLTRNKTDYRIVINPLYNQIEFNPGDYKYLCELFGRENVYDFSGINEITNHMINYYDFAHYRPHIAKYILDVIYQ